MKYTHESLDALAHEGDTLADGIVAALIESGQVESINEVLHHFHTHEQPVPEELPDSICEYLRITSEPPPWTDYERIARTHTFFLDDGLHIAAVLSLGSMVACYAVPEGAKVLTMTHRLKQPKHRFAETGQFCFYMMNEGAFQADDKFVPAIQKVRLIHAAVRYLIVRSGKWPAHFGLPINQEDLLGALMLFSVQVLQGLERLGVPATPEEGEDYLYMWRVTGVMLGIREDIIPQTVAEGIELNKLLKERHIGPSEEGVELTRDLITMYEDLVPGKMFDGVIAALVRLVIEDEIADLVQVPRSGWDNVVRHLPRVSSVFEHAENTNSLARYVLDKAGQMMLEGQARWWGTNHAYEIPDDLRAAWENHHHP